MKKLLFGLAICFLMVGSVWAKDRALLIGVDFYQQRGVPTTKGAVADAEAMQQLLINKFNFAPGSITLLRNLEATTQNILGELDKIVSQTKQGDRVFIHYAGHGFQVPDEYIKDEKDDLDEVIAPYNISVLNKPNGNLNLTLVSGTYITDDIFNDYKVKLSGRSVVMLFDSCHSGTISRGMSSESQRNSRYLRLEENTRSMSKPDAYSFVPGNLNSRDLFVAKDENMGDGNINGVVVISAASPYQEAFPIEVNGKLRGALSYLFEKAHSGSYLPKIADLKAALVKEMKSLVSGGLIRAGQNGQFQVPEVEVFSKVDIWNQPLFGTAITNLKFPDSSSAYYSSGLVSALSNQFSKINVNLSLKWSGAPKANQGKPRFIDKFYLDDEMEYSVEISEAGYLYVLVFSADDKASCIFPAYVEKNGKPVEADVDNYLEKGKHYFPRKPGQFPKVKEDYTPFATPPIGKDVWVALLSKQKLPIGEKQNYESWKEIFERIGLEKVQKEVWGRTRGTGNKSSTKLTDADWQSAIIVVETLN